MEENLLGIKIHEVNDNMIRKACPRSRSPIVLRVKRFGRWSIPRTIKPGKRPIKNSFRCRTRAEGLCKTMAKKRLVQACRLTRGK